ncbi:helix-turn-helix domain-containing protein [Streptomyces sp. NRRL S-646]|uniref:helix-turn-helix domain-containing protein n=1 Tax=Streptomyces sp. NRRL S-646 TaxID=1463917 RepID=UPI00099BC15D|nr:helix-turn-helix domain-containing protein [Streptomyces sp. NRRL S-646]
MPNSREGARGACWSCLSGWRRAKAIRFSTLGAICRELGYQPGDLLSFRDS